MNIWQHVLLSASGLAAASLVGSVIGLAVKRIPHKWNDIFMGFCAGTMLAAAIVGLLLPAIGQCGFSDWLLSAWLRGWLLSVHSTASHPIFIALPVSTVSATAPMPRLIAYCFLWLQ